MGIRCDSHNGYGHCVWQTSPSKTTWNSLFMQIILSTWMSFKASYNIAVSNELYGKNNRARKGLTVTWWRHQMETFSVLLAICAGNSPVTGEFPAQRPVTRSFDVFFDLRPNKRLSKQWWGWWFETPSRPLWRHCNEICVEFFICLSHPVGITSDVHNAVRYIWCP